MGHPISLFHEDGLMCKNAKSELVVMLESSTSPLKDIPINPINTVIINDGKAFTQGINVSNLKKNQLSGQALYASVLIKQFIVADTIIEVFDNNINFSVKACRAGPDAHKIVYRWFSSNSAMMYLRISRISFTIYANASQLLVKHYHTHTKRIPCLVGSGNEEVLKITHNGIEKARDLFSSYEESDSKISIFRAVSSDKDLRNHIEMGV